MGLSGMYAFSRAGAAGGDSATHSTTIELEPGDGFAQVSLGDFWEWDDQSWAIIGITRITHRRKNGLDKVITFPSAFFTTDTADLTRIVYDANLSSITVQTGVQNCYLNWILQIFYSD
jgi:hypothetical protein